MKVAVVGSRKRKDRQSVIDFIESLPADAVVVSGGCRGVDTWAVQAARRRGLACIEILPDLKGCRRRWEFAERYYARNRKVAETCDVMAAFVSNDRRGGTENAVKHARKLGKRVLLK